MIFDLIATNENNLPVNFGKFEIICSVKMLNDEKHVSYTVKINTLEELLKFQREVEKYYSQPDQEYYYYQGLIVSGTIDEPMIEIFNDYKE